MKTALKTLFLTMLIQGHAIAGNGVERGSVMIKGASGIQSEIKIYLEKNLIKCSANANESEESFEVKEVSERHEKIDQGIIDIYYKIKMLRTHRYTTYPLTVEVLDSDFHNWRHYEEKLSLEILSDPKNICY